MTEPERPDSLLERLPKIAALIESRPVLGHWVAMMADADAKTVRAAADEIRDLRAEVSLFRADPMHTHLMEQSRVRLAAVHALQADVERQRETIRRLTVEARANTTTMLMDVVAERDALREEVERLNKWADDFSDAQLKERQTAEEYQRELRAERGSLRAELEAAKNDARRWQYVRLCALPDPTEQFVAGFALVKQPGIDGEMSDAAVDFALAARGDQNPEAAG